MRVLMLRDWGPYREAATYDLPRAVASEIFRVGAGVLDVPRRYRAPLIRSPFDRELRPDGRR